MWQSVIPLHRAPCKRTCHCEGASRPWQSVLSNEDIPNSHKKEKLTLRAVLTRVKSASVTVEGKIIGKIGPGFLILLGVTHEDTEAQAVKLADKLMGLRIFEDENEKMNRSLADVGGEVLVVSQFTLYGNCKKGRRPEFLAAARPEIAVPLYEKFIALCRDKGFHVETGEFGASMEVESVNDGPVTLIVDTDQL